MKNLLIIAAVTFSLSSVAEANNNFFRTQMLHSGHGSFSGGCASGHCGSPCGGGCGGCGSHFGFLKRGSCGCPKNYSSCCRRIDLFAFVHGGTYCTKWSSMSCADGWNYLCYRLRKCHRGLRHGCCGCCPYTGYQPPHMGCGCGSSATMMQEAVEPADESADELPPSPAPPMAPPAAKEKSARWLPNGRRVLQGIVF